MNAEIDASRPMGTFTDRQVWQTISRHAFIVSVGAYGRESCACGWYRDGWDSPGFEARSEHSVRSPAVTALLPVPADAAARHDLADGSVLWRLESGAWLIDHPLTGRHEIVAADEGVAS